MTRKREWVPIALFFGLAVCSAVGVPAGRPAAAAGAEPPSQASDYRFADLVGGLPEGYVWHYRAPADFDVYSAKGADGRSGVGIYLGYHPDFPHVQSEQTGPGVVAGRAVTWVIGDGKAAGDFPFWRECRFEYRPPTENMSLPLVAHVWIYAATGAEIDRLLESLKELRILPPGSSVSDTAPARSSTLTPEETKWALRARAMWRAYRLDWDSKEKLQQAEREILAAGSRREATANLRAVLRKLPKSDPARYPIGFTMALLDLGYEDGREVLLRYLRAQQRPDSEPYGVAVSKHSTIPDPNDDPREMDIAYDTDGLGGMVYTVYERRQDPVLLSALLDLAEHADGCVGELMWGVLHNLARDHPRELLLGLREKPKGVWRRTVDSLAIESRHGPANSYIPAETEYAEMSRIARSTRDPLSERARRLLDEVRGEQGKQRGEGSAKRAD